MKELIFKNSFPLPDMKTIAEKTDEVDIPQVFLPIPHKNLQLNEYRKTEGVVQAAVNASNQYQLDLEGFRTDGGVTASYTLESGKYPVLLKAVVNIANRVLFFIQNDYRLFLVLEYDTHYTISGE